VPFGDPAVSKLTPPSLVVTPGNLPPRVNQQILKALQAEVAPEVFITKGAYDGRSNMFCASKLLLSSEDTQEVC
jgi:hypothetical protein